MSELALLLERFDGLIETPADVEKLEQTILQWAVMGRLVEQCPDDEPAQALAAKITSEKERLVKEKVIRRPKEQPRVRESEVPFFVPEHWVWMRLGEIGDWGAGATPSRRNPYYYDGKMPWLKTGELNDSYISSAEEHITELAIKETSVRLCKPGDVLIAMYGATIGKLGILNFEATTNQACCACTVFDGVYNRFLFTFLFAMRSRFRQQGAGGAQPNISKTKIVATPFPLPPLEEQKRIVAKVDALFGQTRALKARLETAGTVRDRLQGAAVGRLSGAQSPDETQAAWRQVEAMFDHIHTTPTHIDSLKQTILQLAVMGRLVPQDPHDEPASVLLERIAAEKARLVKEGKIRKGKKLGKISAEDQPFDIPERWQFARISEVSLLVTDGEHSTPPRVPHKAIPMATAKNVRDGYLDLRNTDFVSLETAEKSWNRCKPTHDDLLIVCVGATTGRSSLAKNPPDMVLVRSVALIRPYAITLHPEFLSLFMDSPVGQTQIWNNVRQTAQPVLYLGKIKQIIIPMPPLAEQKRIVAKVDELLALCDRVAAGLVSAEAARTQLLDAVLAQS